MSATKRGRDMASSEGGGSKSNTANFFLCLHAKLRHIRFKPRIYLFFSLIATIVLFTSPKQGQSTASWEVFASAVGNGREQNCAISHEAPVLFAARFSSQEPISDFKVESRRPCRGARPSCGGDALDLRVRSILYQVWSWWYIAGNLAHTLYIAAKIALGSRHIHSTTPPNFDRCSPVSGRCPPSRQARLL